MIEPEHTPSQLPMVAAFGANAPITMSSREIADLCEKRHDHVLRDIEKMLADIAAPKFGVSDAEPKFGPGDFLASYTDSTGRSLKEYRLPRDLTMTLITGYRADLRFKVIKKLEQLEEEKRSGGFTLPRSYEEALEGLLAQVRQNTLLIAANEEKDATIGAMRPKAEEYDAYLSREGVVLIRDFCNKHGVKVRHPGYALRSRSMMHQKKTLATQVGIKAGIIRNIVEPEGFEYENSKGEMIEAQSAMIVKEREADLLQILIDDYGQTAFRNPTAFQRARMLLSGGGLA